MGWIILPNSNLLGDILPESVAKSVACWSTHLAELYWIISFLYVSLELDTYPEIRSLRECSPLPTFAHHLWPSFGKKWLRSLLVSRQVEALLPLALLTLATGLERSTANSRGSKKTWLLGEFNELEMDPKGWLKINDCGWKWSKTRSIGAMMMIINLNLWINKGTYYHDKSLPSQCSASADISWFHGHVTQPASVSSWPVDLSWSPWSSDAANTSQAETKPSLSSQLVVEVSVQPAPRGLLFGRESVADSKHRSPGPSPSQIPCWILLKPSFVCLPVELKLLTTIFLGLLVKFQYRWVSQREND